MRRCLSCLVFVVLGVLLVVPSAGAATGQTFHFRFHGTFAEAEWFHATSTSFTDTYVNVSKSKSGSQELFLDRFRQTFDSNGNTTGGVDTSLDVTSGFSFSIDAKKFDTASLSGSGLPATRCTFDANFNLVGCSNVTLSVSVQWTGQGPLGHETANDHFKLGGFSVNDHFSGAVRNALASGTVGSATLSANDLAFADMGRANSGTVLVCIGNNC